MTNHRISIIVAHSKNLVIGRGNDLIWKIPNDLKRFKEISVGHPVIMGRKTWESLPEKFRPLAGRTNIVVTRDASYQAPGAIVAMNIEEAIEKAEDAEGSDEIIVMGGGQIYKEALPYTDRLYLTVVDKYVEGDAYFPEYPEFTKKVFEEDHEFEGLKFKYLTLEK